MNGNHLKLNESLLKVRRGRASTLGWRGVAEVVEHLGGRVERVEGIARVKGVLSSTSDALLQSTYAGAVQKVARTVPRRLRLGEGVIVELSPIRRAGTGLSEATYVALVGVEGWKISIAGRSHEVMPDDRMLGDAVAGFVAVPAARLPVERAIEWLDAVGWRDLCSKALGVEACAIEDGPESDAAIGTCGVCFQRVELDGRTLAAHVYTNPSTHAIVGPCSGARFGPYETTVDGTRFAVAHARRLLVETKKALSNLEGGRVTSIRVDHGAGRASVVRRGDAAWSRVYAQEVSVLEREVAVITASIEVLERAVFSWRPRAIVRGSPSTRTCVAPSIAR